MLNPEIYRQRLPAEFITKKDIYNKEMYHNFLIDLCLSLKMTKLLGPIVGAGEIGASAWMVWKESGVQIHAWGKQGLVAVDIFSCKPYTKEIVLEVIKRHFGEVEVHFGKVQI
jgi:S-adenosylmethionine/arginine decarboxylase-like enzyme